MNSQIHVEVVQKSFSCCAKETIIKWTNVFLKNLVAVSPGTVFYERDFANYNDLNEHVGAISVCSLNQDKPSINIDDADIRYHVYRLDQQGCDEENLDDGEEALSAGTHWQLPSKEFFGLWESLVYDTKVKEETLNFVETTLLFSDKHIDPNILNWNKVLLLHGPPGTGKTSLCKALAQKLSIRLGSRYPRTQLIEINSHSLFSKWFSESGKLVMKLFQKIRELAEDPQILVCVLIDEVESLTHARTAAFNGSDPSDSIRVVNAVLTQLDNIRQYPNVFILTTSNMTGAIDLAFVDRADIKQYIGPPSVIAIYQIYLSCVNELMTKEIISPKTQLLPYKVLETCQFHYNEETKCSLQLLELSKYSVGMSGRSLRKVPFISHALYINSDIVDIQHFFAAMKMAIEKYKNDSEAFLVNGEK